ncbi:MAG: ABC transporter permease, partial [Alphaproteobacteria bacterium]|nr:ABC transporter permease [Alphaproteobacteria bacterium]
MRLGLWLRFARRDLRSGLQGFWIFLLCLFLGTAAIAVIGSLASAVSRGIEEQGQPLLGGDVEFALIHRQAAPAELAFLDEAGDVSRVATLRVMAMAKGQVTLAEAKTLDGAYPLYGAAALTSGMPLADALERRDGRFGVAVDPLLLARLDLAVGETLRIGNGEFEVRAVIAVEPDRISDGIILGPRLFLSDEALAETGLIVPGSLITWRYRVKLAPPAAADTMTALVSEAEEKFPEAGW